ncbi:hypothetical protein SRABI80_04724 [Peribacillus frigoritolerans]|nr:hypothetical protein SRABI80_04724 [Peribacillus frigoritolerans]
MIMITNKNGVTALMMDIILLTLSKSVPIVSTVMTIAPTMLGIPNCSSKIVPEPAIMMTVTPNKKNVMIISTTLPIKRPQI